MKRRAYMYDHRLPRCAHRHSHTGRSPVALAALDSLDHSQAAPCADALSAVRSAHSNPRPPASRPPAPHAPVARLLRACARQRAMRRPSPTCEHARPRYAPPACMHANLAAEIVCVFDCAVRSAPSYSDYFLLDYFLLQRAGQRGLGRGLGREGSRQRARRKLLLFVAPNINMVE